MNAVYFSLAGFLIAASLVAGGYYFYANNNGTNATTTVSIEENPPIVETTLPPGIELVELPISSDLDPSIPVPDLDRSFIVTVKSLSPETIKKVEEKIANLTKSLKENTDNFGLWIELGLQTNSLGDYEAARDAWEYASAIRPGNSLSFGNLGFLYGYYLKEPDKAEKNYLQAIKNDPKLAYLYVQTAEFYRDVLKDDSKAKALLEEGLKVNLGDPQIQSALRTF